MIWSAGKIGVESTHDKIEITQAITTRNSAARSSRSEALEELDGRADDMAKGFNGKGDKGRDPN